MKNKFGYFLASYFGVGFFPFASGTAGSLMTLPLVMLAGYYGGTAGILTAAVLAFGIGVWATNEVLKTSENKDPSLVVIDETAGQLMTFVLVGDLLYQSFDKWYLYIIGFVAFRFFDIIKMGPVRWADSKLHNAWGVMLDDVFAGIFAAVLLLGIEKYFMAF